MLMSPARPQDWESSFFFSLSFSPFFFPSFFFHAPTTPPAIQNLYFHHLNAGCITGEHCQWNLFSRLSRAENSPEPQHNCLWLWVQRSPWQHKQVKSSVVFSWWGEVTERSLSSQNSSSQHPLGRSPSLTAGSHPHTPRVQATFNTPENTIYKINTSVSHWLLIRAMLQHYIGLRPNTKP